MILLRKPSDSRIRRFLDEQRSLPFSYPEVGASREGAPPGYPAEPITQEPERTAAPPVVA